MPPLLTALLTLLLTQAPAQPSPTPPIPPDTPIESPRPAGTPTRRPSTPAADAPLVRPARIVAYEPQTVVRLLTRVRFTTLIVLPESEDIQDFVCGDRDNWVISGTANVAYVKPAQVGAHTNLNLVTSRGAIYSFVLDEVSGSPGRDPDLRVQIEPTRDAAERSGLPRVQASAQVRALTAERDDARAALARARTDAAATADAARALAPLQVRFPYRFDADKAPFYVVAIYHDGTSTYLQLRASELPTLYELRDGTPSLVSFTVRHGVYVIPRVLDAGYLALGKRRLTFARRAE